MQVEGKGLRELSVEGRALRVTGEGLRVARCDSQVKG
jgi:hypothetical protein